MTANDLTVSPRRPNETESVVRDRRICRRPWFGGHRALIVSDIVAIAFIGAHLGGRSPYGRLPKAAPPLVDAAARSEAQPAETGTCPSDRLDPVHPLRRAAGLYGGARAHGVRRDLHRAAPPVLATVAPRR